MWNSRYRDIPTVLAFLALAGTARADDPPDDVDIEPPTAAQSLADIADLVDIGPESFEVALLPPATQLLLDVRTGAQAAVFDGRVLGFYGEVLGTGQTGEEAADSFWIFHRDAFGVDGLETELTQSRTLAGGQRVFCYQQTIDGLPVEYATGRLLVREGPAFEVTWAAMNCVPPPADGFAPIAMTQDEAVAAVAVLPQYSNLTQWSEPQLVVFAGAIELWGLGAERFGPPVRAWKFRGDSADDAESLAALTFFVDAAARRIVHIRNEIMKLDINGTVTAKVSPMPLPDRPINPPIAVPVADIQVTLNSVPVQTTYTNSSGEFFFSYNGPTGVTLTTNASAGRWQDVDTWTGTGPEISAQGTWDGVSAVNLALNDSPTAARTAQANALHYHAQVHNFFTTRAPWTGLDQKLRVIVNYSGGMSETGFQGSSIVYLPGDPNDPVNGAGNAANSTVIAHEYGHFVVNQLRLAQWSFGEGFADAVAIVTYDTPCMFLDCNGMCGRDYAGIDGGATYPCNCAPDPHCCGRVLAGLWWDIRNQLVASHGLASGTLRTRMLFVKWAMMTNGGMGDESAHPLLAQEIIIADGNGNPSHSVHKVDICEAAAMHGLATGSGGSCTVLPPPGTGPILSFRDPVAIYTSTAGACGSGCINPFGLVAGDVDADGKTDIVLACEGVTTDANPDKLVIYFGQSATSTSYSVDCTRTLSIPLPAGTNRPAKVVMTELDLFAIPPLIPGGRDLVVTLQGTPGQPNSAGVLVLKNLGASPWYDASSPTHSRFFTASDGLTITNPVGLVVADLDNNGLKDIAIAGEDGFAPRLGLVWFDLISGQIQTTANLVTLSQALRPGYDLAAWESSGVWRLAMTNSVSNALHLLRFTNVPSRTFEWFNNTPADPNPPEPGHSKGITIADFDLDGQLDIATSCLGVGGPFGADVACWYRQSTTDRFETRRDFAGNSPSEGIAVGQLSKLDSNPLMLDDWPDLAASSLNSNPAGSSDYDPRITILPNSPGALVLPDDRFFPNRRFPIDPDLTKRPFSRVVAIFDLNGDGFPDVLSANRGGSETGADASEGVSWTLNQNN